MLHLGLCESLVGLPNNFGRSVPKLKRLLMSRCTNLKTLPNSIHVLAHLVELDIRSCENLSYLWENDANIEVNELFVCQWIGEMENIS